MQLAANNYQSKLNSKSYIKTLYFNKKLYFAQVSSNDVIGKWKNTKTSMTVEVYKTNNTYSAKIINAIEKSQIGKIFIWNLVFNKAKSEWNGGEVQLLNMAHSASCFIKLKDIETANITGYHGLRLFGSTEKYYREK